ncbi:helix-turn-helix transcriptional regulator [Lichenifustis flavocetrariae]|uniref:WYL domain-containing protein n=1 Tax=Lichenifustis flavocetrariae TaxID=2949735 RepID=A0AA41YZ89_9HYPH|nr:WYL domain-containing protein [Lichenifustis flavocetrariae]MCW6506417.1 WYL domain-containing protein [Lichenifustis flavocetrariae]
MDTIRQGCWREEAVAIGYVDKAGASTERTILPLAITYLDRNLMVLAWCRLREAFRMFEANRISKAQLAGERFRPRRAGLLRSYLAQLQARQR